MFLKIVHYLKQDCGCSGDREGDLRWRFQILLHGDIPDETPQGAVKQLVWKIGSRNGKANVELMDEVIYNCPKGDDCENETDTLKPDHVCRDIKYLFNNSDCPLHAGMQGAVIRKNPRGIKPETIRPILIKRLAIRPAAVPRRGVPD